MDELISFEENLYPNLTIPIAYPVRFLRHHGRHQASSNGMMIS